MSKMSYKVKKSETYIDLSIPLSVAKNLRCLHGNLTPQLKEMAPMTEYTDRLEVDSYEFYQLLYAAVSEADGD